MDKTWPELLKGELWETFYDIPQAATELGVSRQTIYRWINSGKLPIERVGKEILIGKDTLYGLEDLRLVSLIRQNIIRKLRHEAEQYHWLDENKQNEVVLTTELKGYKSNVYTFELTLNNGKKRKIVICIGEIKVSIDEAEPVIRVEIISIIIDSKKSKAEIKWI